MSEVDNKKYIVFKLKITSVLFDGFLINKFTIKIDIKSTNKSIIIKNIFENLFLYLNVFNLDKFIYKIKKI